MQTNASAVELQERADALAASGDLLGALAAFQAAMHLVPDNAVLLEAVAQIQTELDDHAAALVAAARAAELAPEVREDRAPYTSLSFY